jgi:phenylalanine-4-hydroxylase
MLKKNLFFLNKINKVKINISLFIKKTNIFSTKTKLTEEKVGLLLKMENKPGVLAKFANIFANNGVNLSYINSKPSKFYAEEKKYIDFFIDCEFTLGSSNLQKALNELKEKGISIDILESDIVPWFPKNKHDLNDIGREVLSAGEQLSSDHPGFKDEIYRKRREDIVAISNKYNMEDELNIPIITYTEEEKEVWKYVWDRLIPLLKKHACEEVRENMDNFIKEVGFSGNDIPQVKDISTYLLKKTNTIFRPVAGLLSQREFLNGLALRVFHSTQYIRHKSVPLYTPEPDIIHEFLGHSILFANKDFADFSQEIGLASLGASDEDIVKLGNIYWFTIEFGLCIQKGETKIYGAGILSSPSEIEWSISGKPKLHDFDLNKMATFPYSITDIQTNYFVAPSFAEMKRLVIKYGENIKKSFNVSYNISNSCIEIDRKIKTIKK